MVAGLVLLAEYPVLVSKSQRVHRLHAPIGKWRYCWLLPRVLRRHHRTQSVWPPVHARRLQSYCPRTRIAVQISQDIGIEVHSASDIADWDNCNSVFDYWFCHFSSHHQALSGSGVLSGKIQRSRMMQRGQAGLRAVQI